MGQGFPLWPMFGFFLCCLCIMISVAVALAFGAEDHSPLLGPAFISIGVTFIYGGSFFLIWPEQAAKALQGSRVDWIPPTTRGIVLVLFGGFWTLVGIAGLIPS